MNFLLVFLTSLPGLINSGDLICEQAGLRIADGRKLKGKFEDCIDDKDCLADGNAKSQYDFCYNTVCCTPIEFEAEFGAAKLEGTNSTSLQGCLENDDCSSYNKLDTYQVVCGNSQNKVGIRFCKKVTKLFGGEWRVEGSALDIKTCESDGDCNSEDNEKCYIGYTKTKLCGTTSLCLDGKPNADLMKDAAKVPYMFIKPHKNNTFCLEPFMSYAAYLFAGSSNKYLKNYYEQKQHRFNHEFGKTKSCTNNSECGIVQFCDYQYKYIHDKNQLETFCVPNPLEGADYIFPLLRKDGIGLTWCNDSTECQNIDPSGFCYLARNQEPVLGFCVLLNICGGKVPASLVEGGQQCMSDDDCVNHGVSKGKSYRYSPKCKEVRYELDHYFIMGNKIDKLGTGVCCYSRNAHSICKVGRVQMPLKKCSNNLVCNADSWCDDTYRHCCRNTNDNKQLCRDNVTTLLLEKKCKDDADCSGFGMGYCSGGHCCPKIKESKNGIEYLGIYTTQLRCNPYRPVEKNFTLSFCNPITKKLTVLPNSINKELGKKCYSNPQCSADGKMVCVFKYGENGTCFENPTFKSSWPLYVLSFSIVGMCTFPFIMVMICYFSGSLEDALDEKEEKMKEAEGGVEDETKN